MIKTARGLSHSIINIVYKTLFPLKCAGCAKEESFLCESCESKLRYLSDAEPKNIKSQNISRLISCFPYEQPISSLIILGKYSFMPDVFAHLARLSIPYLQRWRSELKNHVLCPIPLSKQRLRWRGFNQSQKLCETFSQALGLAQTQYLVRIRNTKTQKDLSGADRLKNVRNCFAVDPTFTKLIPGQQILLVDDVATTGTTLDSAADVLMKAGAKTVWALTIARD